jgi:hypothetical protein
VNLPARSLRVQESKTSAGIRKVDLTPAVERANEMLRHQGIEPMGHVTPYSLRRCFSSLR